MSLKPAWLHSKTLPQEKKLGTQEEGVFPWLPFLQTCFRIFSPGQARDTQGIDLCPNNDLIYIQVILRFRKCLGSQDAPGCPDEGTEGGAQVSGSGHKVAVACTSDGFADRVVSWRGRIVVGRWELVSGLVWKMPHLQRGRLEVEVVGPPLGEGKPGAGAQSGVGGVEPPQRHPGALCGEEPGPSLSLPGSSVTPHPLLLGY